MALASDDPLREAVVAVTGKSPEPRLACLRSIQTRAVETPARTGDRRDELRDACTRPDPNASSVSPAGAPTSASYRSWADECALRVAVLTPSSNQPPADCWVSTGGLRGMSSCRRLPG